MKAVIQRVSSSAVTVDGKVVGSCKNGYMILFCACEGDTLEDVMILARKTVNLRVFCDEEGKMNKSLLDIDGETLVISQFTLYANCKKGNRPSFIKAGNPELANQLYEYIIEECKKQIPNVQTGIFGADMKIELVNDGPFTIVLDSNELFGL